MRTAFVNTLMNCVKKDKTIFLLTGDLGFTVFEEFKKTFQENFINGGVAEQNLIGVAAGLALTNKTVYVYSIVPFITYRCLEHIRNDIAYNNLNVKIIGVGGGFSYGIMGQSHHSLEDIACMKSLPNMKVICPGDPVEVEEAVKFMNAEKGSFYLRLGKRGEKIIHQKPAQFDMSKGIILKNGKDITILSTGNMLETASEVSSLLKSYADISLISIPMVKPIDKETIINAANQTKAIFTLEEHVYDGGFGSSVAEVLLESECRKVYFKRFAVKDVSKVCGDQNFLRKLNELSVNQIYNNILSYLLKCKE